MEQAPRHLVTLALLRSEAAAVVAGLITLITFLLYPEIRILLWLALAALELVGLARLLLYIKLSGVVLVETAAPPAAFLQTLVEMVAGAAQTGLGVIGPVAAAVLEDIQLQVGGLPDIVAETKVLLVAGAVAGAELLHQRITVVAPAAAA